MSDPDGDEPPCKCIARSERNLLLKKYLIEFIRDLCLLSLSNSPGFVSQDFVLCVCKKMSSRSLSNSLLGEVVIGVSRVVIGRSSFCCHLGVSSRLSVIGGAERKLAKEIAYCSSLFRRIKKHYSLS